MIVDIGCGENPRGDINLDVRKTRATNLVASAEYLPFRDQVVTKILCSQVLEHLTHPSEALNEMNRVLKIGGVAEIDVPTVSFTNQAKIQLFKFFFNLPFSLKWRELKWMFKVLGLSELHPQRHKTVVTERLIEKVLIVTSDREFNPMILISLENFLNKRFKVMRDVKIARLNWMRIFQCTKRGKKK